MSALPDMTARGLEVQAAKAAVVFVALARSITIVGHTGERP